MGGYGSGRRRRHHITNDCLPIDTTSFREHRLLTGKKACEGCSITYTSQSKTVKEKVTEQKHSLYVLVKHYESGEGDFARWGAVGHVTLLYGVRSDKEESGKRTVDIPLVVTHPNYGGCRYWLLAPCCGKRVRIVYLPTYGSLEHITPQCRECLDLHYASQQQSYIERHKTYERYLLANYGYAWAEMDYHCLRERYQEITPELDYLKQRSILHMRMRMLRLLMSFTRVMLRTHMYNLRSLKSEEDRRVYYDHVVKQYGEAYGLDLVRLLGIGAQMERDARESSSEVFDRSYNQLTNTLMQSLHSDEGGTDPQTRQAIEEAALEQKINMRYLLAYKEQVDEDIERLEQLKQAA